MLPDPASAETKATTALREPAATPRRRWLRLGAAIAVLSALGVSAWLAGDELLFRNRMQRGKAAFALDRCAEAFNHFSDCLNQRPDDRNVMLWVARCFRRNDDFDLAEVVLDRCAESPALAEAVAFERLLLRANRGDLDEVLSECEKLLEANHADSLLIREAIIKGAVSVYRPDVARSHLAPWLKQHPDHPQAIFLDVLIGHLGAPLPMQAAKLRRVVELDPQRGDARQMLAELLLDLGLAREALPHLEKLRKDRPNDALIPTRLADCFDLLGKQDQAVALIDHVLSKHPGFPLAQMTRGKLALRGGDLSTAESLLRTACRKLPGNVAAHHQWVQCLRQQGKDEEAKAADLHIQAIRDDNARLRAIITKELPASPRDARLQAEMGVLFLRLGSTDDGLRWLHRAVRLDPRQREANQALAVYHERAGLVEQARKHRQAATSP